MLAVSLAHRKLIRPCSEHSARYGATAKRLACRESAVAGQVPWRGVRQKSRSQQKGGPQAAFSSSLSRLLLDDDLDAAVLRLAHVVAGRHQKAFRQIAPRRT